MEILLAVAVATVAVAGWFTSTTFRTRIRENAVCNGSGVPSAAARPSTAERPPGETGSPGKATLHERPPIRKECRGVGFVVGYDAGVPRVMAGQLRYNQPQASLAW